MYHDVKKLATKRGFLLGMPGAIGEEVHVELEFKVR